MSEPSQYAYGTQAITRPRAISTGQLLGQVSFLVAVALGFTALGSVVGKEIAYGTARILSFVGFGMLIVASFGGRTFRVGAFAMGWLFATALVIGLGLAPFIDYIASVNPDAVTAAAGGTALTVLGMGCIGFIMSRDLAVWMRPLSLICLVLVGVSIGFIVFTADVSPVISLAIYGVSALLILVNFNYLRKHGTEDQAVMLATGIFVSIINIFVSLLNVFSR